jgi:hypothetical protein
MGQLWTNTAVCLLLALLAGGTTSVASTLAPTQLRCEYQVDPPGVDTPSPRLSWVLESSDPRARGAAQSGYQIQVGVAAGEADLWDSGKVASRESVLVPYEGKPLTSRMRCGWRVRVWDERGRPSPWSDAATWTMGVLEPREWRARWIGARAADTAPREGERLGYAVECPGEDDVQWVQVDLGSARSLERVVLHPSYHNDPRMGGWIKGYGFPRRFRVEVSDDPTFATCTVIADHSQADFPNPGHTPVSFGAAGARGRYIRFTATRLYPRPGISYCLTLAELEVFSGGANAALDCPVAVRDGYEGSGWGRVHLTDGRRLAGEDVPVDEGRDAALLLRKQFRLSTQPRRAVARVCGLGYGELYVNGRKVGDAVLDPAFTDYTKRVSYRTFDVTDLLSRGDNALGVMLGNGWYHLVTGDLFGNEHAPWTAPPKLLVELELTGADGATRFLRSDPTWRWSTGPLTFNCVRGGETHDFRLHRPGWAAAGFDDSGWKPAVAVPAPAGKLVPQAIPPVRVTQRIRPVKLTEPRPGVYVYDLGVHIPGYARFTTSGPAGTKVTLDFDENLNADGTITTKSLNSHTNGRYQVGEMLLSGRAQDVFEPRFTYHGFRYVQVRGVTRPPKLDDLVGCRIHTDLAEAGDFACSSETVNHIHAACRFALLNCLHSIQTEPAREKINWTEDAHNSMEVGIANFDFATFARKWLDDVVDSQEPNGHVPPINPNAGWARSHPDGAPPDWSDPWWGGVVVEMPWLIYTYYGDRRTLEESYEPMRRFVDYLGTTARDEVFLDWWLGDWLEVDCGGRPSRTPIVQTSTAAYCYYAQLVSRAATVLGKPDDASRYAALSERIRSRFNERFLDPVTGLYAPDSQSAQVMPLYLGIAPEDRRELILQRLVENIHARKDHLSAGFVGYLYLLYGLTAAGRTDLAYTLATQPDYPGWANMLKDGGTTLWEAWNGNAYNFSSLGAVDAWFYQALAGISPDPEGPGFARIIIRPGVVGDLTWVRAHYDSVHGRIAVSWRREGGRLDLTVTVPASTTATVYIPTSAPADVTEGGKPLGLAPGVASLPPTPGVAVCQVVAGTYEFAAPAP